METIKYLSTPIFTSTDLRFTTTESFLTISRRRIQFRFPHLPPKQLQLCQFPSRLPANRSSATSSILVLASEGPATSGNYSEFFMMGSLLLCIYLIANFIVPEMITKSMKSADKDGEGGE
ncbi:hypothetical protein ZOSMA_26G00400 [Zostera marina]|uniref:Uncharacterized protein n=1 Tax=Zostera marina TaxID=29655 RepID=A0A0K9PEB0_ZOSMR|nr:hypothetical protein ZOSMA_26G00400 [Zostera marina]